MAPTRGVVLAHTDYPLYTIHSLDERHFLVAGGGGQAKSGIPNAVEILQLKKGQNGFTAEALSRHDTGIRAVMNSSTFCDDRNHFLATGEDELCKIYSVKYKVVTEDSSSKDNDKTTRQRKTENGSKAGEDSSSDSPSKKLTFQIEETGSVETDFSKDGGFQKCVKFSPDHKSLATGGADGHLRVWKYPELTKIFDIEAHKNEIDDLDFSPDGSKIITVSRDKNGSMWHSKDGSKVTDLLWEVSKTEPYRFRACRYGIVEDKKDKFNFFTVNIPVTRSNKSQCYLSLWDPGRYNVKKTVKTGIDTISSFSVSPDGIYLGLGYISGSVSVYIAFSLKKLYHVVESHSIFVTGLDFLPYSKAALEVTGAPDFRLLSISADNSIQLHLCPERSYIHPYWIIVGLILSLYALFYLMTELGL